jgi:SAM-dependent methyltransferase
VSEAPPPERPLKLDSPLLVHWEYASEERLAVRNKTYRDLVEGANAEEMVFEAVKEVRPRRMLEVGCGTGELAERVQRELGSEVVALDVSPRMVELTSARGVDAHLGDVQDLPFGDGEFDCAVAAWVLYHVPNVDRSIAELARVLAPGGTLVASTLGEGNLAELWEAVGDSATRGLSFGGDNGQAALRRHFSHVERRDAQGTVSFPDRESMHRFVAATITRAHLADRVPEITEPLRARTFHVVFVAQKAANR